MVVVGCSDSVMMMYGKVLPEMKTDPSSGLVNHRTAVPALVAEAALRIWLARRTRHNGHCLSPDVGYGTSGLGRDYSRVKAVNSLWAVA